MKWLINMKELSSQDFQIFQGLEDGMLIKEYIIKIKKEMVNINIHYRILLNLNQIQQEQILLIEQHLLLPILYL